MLDASWTNFLRRLHEQGFDFWSSKDLASAKESVYELYSTTPRKEGKVDDAKYKKEVDGIRSKNEIFPRGVRQEGDTVFINNGRKESWRVYVNANPAHAPAIMKVLVEEMFPRSEVMACAKVCEDAALANERLDTIVIYTDGETNAKAIAAQINHEKRFEGKLAKGTVAMARKLAEGVSIGESPRSHQLSFGDLRAYACAAAIVPLCERGRTHFTRSQLEDATERALPRFGLLGASADRNGPDLQPRDKADAEGRMKEFVKAYRRMGFLAEGPFRVEG